MSIIVKKGLPIKMSLRYTIFSLTTNIRCKESLIANINWRAQSKNDPLIFRPFLKVFRSSWQLLLKTFKNGRKIKGSFLLWAFQLRVSKRPSTTISGSMVAALFHAILKSMATFTSKLSQIKHQDFKKEGLYHNKLDLACYNQKF